MEKLKFYYKKTGRAVVAIVIFVALAGCGYSLKGEGLRAPEGVSTIAVQVLENRTSETGIETVFTGDLAYEFTRSKVLRVVDAGAADAILSGTIESMGVETISHTASYSSGERRVTITLKLALKQTGGDILWSDSAISDRETFDVASDKIVTAKNRRAAIKVISERLAEKVHNRILQGF